MSGKTVSASFGRSTTASRAASSLSKALYGAYRTPSRVNEFCPQGKNSLGRESRSKYFPFAKVMEEMLVQPRKASLDTSSIESVNTMLFSAVQFSKALPQMERRPAPQVMLSRLIQFANVPLGIRVTLSDRTTDLSFLHPEKAPSAMESTNSGKTKRSP